MDLLGFFLVYDVHPLDKHLVQPPRLTIQHISGFWPIFLYIVKK